MDAKKVKIFLKLYWIRILIIALGVLFIAGLIYVLIIGLKAFFELEPFYRKMAISGIPVQMVFALFHITLFGLVLIGINYWTMSGGFAKLSQKKVKPQDVNIKWSEVVGMESAKKEVAEVISLLKDRAHLKRVGGKIIKGILMVGPPGCGKTYLAKAIATETGLPFLSAVGSEFMGMYVGVGSTKIRSLFKQARTLSELHGGCLVFIDEIDTIARPRVGVSGMGAGMDYNATVNQLLTELDGMKTTELNITVVAATNVNESELDPALMRAGRFDRKIYVSKPDLSDRKELFKFYLAKTEFDPEINLDALSKRTVGFSPADISNMIREASLIAVRNKNEKISYKDLSQAYDRVMFGLKSQIVLTEKEKIWTAYHEAGHAIIAYLTHPTNDVIKASIVPRRGALGYVGHSPKEEIHAPSREWFLANIKTSLAGYVAEKIKFKSSSSGVGSDFAKSLQLAHSMVYNYGMSDCGLIGNFAALTEPTSQGYRPNISEETKQLIDKESQKILHQCLSEVENILTKEQELLEYFAQELIKKEELDFDEIVEIFEKHGKTRPQDFPV